MENNDNIVHFDFIPEPITNPALYIVETGNEEESLETAIVNEPSISINLEIEEIEEIEEIVENKETDLSEDVNKDIEEVTVSNLESEPEAELEPEPEPDAEPEPEPEPEVELELEPEPENLVIDNELVTEHEVEASKVELVTEETNDEVEPSNQNQELEEINVEVEPSNHESEEINKNHNEIEFLDESSLPDNNNTLTIFAPTPKRKRPRINITVPVNKVVQSNNSGKHLRKFAFM